MLDELITHLDQYGTLKITLNRPECHNAFDDHQIQRLINTLDEARVDPNVRVVVLAGSGKNFSAGGDLNYMKRMGNNTYDENLADAGRLGLLMKTLNFLPKLTIARVQGAAFGGAVGLISCCDIAIGTPNARFSLSEVKVGMAPATIAPYVARAIGERAARRFFTTGEMISADKALSLGLLSEVVEVESLDHTINTLIATLQANAPIGMQKAKQIVFDVVNGDITEEMINHTVKYIADIRDSEEGREGLSAFLEKRPPNWTR